MGAGRDGNPSKGGAPLRRTFSLEKLQGVKDDLIVLKSIWFNKAKGGDHAQRLDNFYSPQAAACGCHSRGITCAIRAAESA